jgi:hypothetical protein
MQHPTPETDPTFCDFARYAQAIEAWLRRAEPFVPEAEDALAVQVERGIVFPSVLLDPELPARSSVDRLIELATSTRLGSVSIVDRSGHHRPVYRGLLVYSWLQAFSLAHETLPGSELGRWNDGLLAWCDLLEADLGRIEWPSGPIPAGRGSATTEAAWMALALHVAGKVFGRDAWTHLASDTIGRLTHHQTDAGPFLVAGGSDNPETHWYHEMVLLHAVASYAAQTDDRHLALAATRNAEFHQNETQPDHATSQPWALMAFIWNPLTKPLAEQILHAAAVQDPSANSGVSLMLLADALYCLRLFLR